MFNPIRPIAKKIGEEVVEGLAGKVAPKVTPAAKPTKKLEWGFKGRKDTDIEDIDYLDVLDEISFKTHGSSRRAADAEEILERNWDLINRGATKNKQIKKYVVDTPMRSASGYKHDILSALNWVNDDFRSLERLDVPRELTGKIIYSKFDFPRSQNPKRYEPNASEIKNWKKNWLSYYNDLNASQKELFDVLSENWEGTFEDLLQAVKLI